MRAGDTHGRLKHFLAIEGLSRSLLIHILDNAERFAPVGDRAVKKVPLLHNNGQIFLGGDCGEGDDRAHREVDALAMSEPVPADEFDQRVNW